MSAKWTFLISRSTDTHAPCLWLELVLVSWCCTRHYVSVLVGCWSCYKKTMHLGHSGRELAQLGGYVL